MPPTVGYTPTFLHCAFSTISNNFQMPPTVGFPPAKEGMEDEEGFFTCAVSVQHKVNIFTTFPIFSPIFLFLLNSEANLLQLHLYCHLFPLVSF